MLAMDVFNDSAFSAIELTGALDKMDYVPQMLGTIPGLFAPKPVRTEVIWIEERSYGAVILATTPRGAPPHQTAGIKAEARAFRTRRLADASTITAAELQGIRAFGSETELKQLSEEVAQRQLFMMQNFQLTFENLRLGCIQGVVTDKDGSTIYDWATEFGQTIPAELDFDLDNAAPADGILRKKATQVVRSITRGLNGVGTASSIVGLCGDAFWDDLIAHPEVRDTYLGWAAAVDLRRETAWQSFSFGGIDWVNYRGTDDNSTVAINTDKVKFFPVGAGIFQWAMSPGESFDWVNTPGRMFYSNLITDRDRNAWASVEMYSYPLPVCTMPQALHRGKRT